MPANAQGLIRVKIRMPITGYNDAMMNETVKEQITGARHSPAANCSALNTHSAPDPLVLDTRPIFERGETPCGPIDNAISALEPAQPLVLLVPFEPVPLYAKLAKDGFSHQAERQPDGSWRVQFRRG